MINVKTNPQVKDLIIDNAKVLLNDKKNSASLNLALSSSWISLQYKAENLKLYAPMKKSPLADYVLILTAQNATQASAMAEMMMMFFKSQQISYRAEGVDRTQWILIDLQDVLIHIFLPETREMYNLEALYQDVAKVEIPQDFYMKVLTDAQTSSNNTNYQDYF